VTTKDEDGGLSSEVSSRLDELFGDQEPDINIKAKPVARPGGIVLPDENARVANKEEKRGIEINEAESDKDSPIRNLNALVFSIDWEITDETMVNFLNEIKRLQQKYKNDKVLFLFLKLHESIGKYIKARKAKAHPDSIKFISSVYKNFEKALLTPGLSDIQKKKLLSTEVKKFKEFKQRIMLREVAIEPEEIVAIDEAAEEKSKSRIAEKAGAVQAFSLDSKEAIDYIIEELKKTIKAEFHTLRQIIKNLGA
jgi:hypothetical protein